MQEKITARMVVYHRVVGGTKSGAVGFLRVRRWFAFGLNENPDPEVRTRGIQF